MSWSCTSLCSTWLRGVTWDAIWAPSDCASIAGEASETVCRAVGAGFCLATDRARWFAANAVWARGAASSSFLHPSLRSGIERRVVGTWGWSGNRCFRWEDVRRQFTGPLTAELHHSNRRDQHHSRRDCGPAPGRSAKKRPAEPVFAVVRCRLHIELRENSERDYFAAIATASQVFKHMVPLSTG